MFNLFILYHINLLIFFAMSDGIQSRRQPCHISVKGPIMLLTAGPFWWGFHKCWIEMMAWKNSRIETVASQKLEDYFDSLIKRIHWVQGRWLGKYEVLDSNYFSYLCQDIGWELALWTHLSEGIGFLNYIGCYVEYKSPKMYVVAWFWVCSTLSGLASG